MTGAAGGTIATLVTAPFDAIKVNNPVYIVAYMYCIGTLGGFSGLFYAPFRAVRNFAFSSVASEVTNGYDRCTDGIVTAD